MNIHFVVKRAVCEPFSLILTISNNLFKTNCVSVCFVEKSIQTDRFMPDTKMTYILAYAIIVMS